MQRIALLVLLSLFGSLCSNTCRADTPACAADTTLLQATTSTPARITGASGERVTLHVYHPQYDPRLVPPLPDMYLLAGDAVEVIATCENYAYVRYESPKLVSAGWVEIGRLQNTGTPHVRPSDTVAQVCAAAANTINRGGNGSFSLPRVPLTPLPKGMEDKITEAMGSDANPIGGFDGMARIIAGGEARKVFPIEDGGTCPSNYLHIWSDDLSRAVAHTDDGQRFGDGQELVQVLGHPLVLQINYGNQTTFALASLDKDGHQSILCQATRVYTTTPRDTLGSNNAVCRAVVANHVTPIPVKDADKNSISLPIDVDQRYKSAFTLGVTRADLFNDGKPRDVGMVAFHYDSSASCGSTSDATFPVILNAHGVADLAEATNKRLIKETTGALDLDEHELQFPGDGRLITYAGNTYFVAYAEPVKQPTNDALAGVFKFTSDGSKSVCSFQPYHFMVAPSAALSNQVVP